MTLRLICALPEPGCTGAPRGLFYEDTPEGRERAQEFAKQQDRPGWGVFECASMACAARSIIRRHSKTSWN